MFNFQFNTPSAPSAPSNNIYGSHYPMHPYHLVTPSPWPFVGGTTALTITTGTVAFMHSYQIGQFSLAYGQVMLWFVMFA